MAVVVRIVLPALPCCPFVRRAFLRGLAVGSVREQERQASGRIDVLTGV